MTLKKAGLLTILASGATSCLIYLGSKVRHGKRHLLRSLKALRPVSDQVRQVRRDTETGDYVLTLAKDRDFRILQLTDLHIAGSWFTHLADRRAVQAVSRLAHQTKPDFIIITGDLTYATLQSLNTNNLGAMRAVRRMTVSYTHLDVYKRQISHREGLQHQNQNASSEICQTSLHRQANCQPCGAQMCIRDRHPGAAPEADCGSGMDRSGLHFPGGKTDHPG